MFEALVNAFRAPDIRRRILFVLAILVVYRALAVVPVPGVNQEAVRALIESQTFLQLLDLFSGGGLSSFSIVAMGVNPYINASIIMQLMTGVVPRLQALSPRRRVRPDQDQPVHALPDRAAGAAPGVRLPGHPELAATSSPTSTS